MEQPNYFSIIPATVRYDKSLKSNEKLIYGELTSLTNKEGYCYASNSYFARLYGVTPDAISRWINKLKNAGYINVQVDKENGNSRRIYISDLLTKKSISIDQKVNTSIDQKVEYNNKDFNNKINNIYSTEQEAPSLEDEVVFSLPLNDKSEYQILKSHIEYWKEIYPLVEIIQELKNMKGWLDSNERKKKTRKGIRKFINSWLARKQDRGITPPVSLQNNMQKSMLAIPDADETEAYLDSIRQMQGD